MGALNGTIVHLGRYGRHTGGRYVVVIPDAALIVSVSGIPASQPQRCAPKALGSVLILGRIQDSMSRDLVDLYIHT